jgi:predicted HD phosphohydrolase
MKSIIDDIEATFQAKGDEMYGESLTMFEHCLLTAQTAHDAGAEDTLVAACLLHDIGHLLVEPDDDFGKHNHDEIGADYLAVHFPQAVTEPVRLHVDAKRYLCAIDHEYFDELSPASQYTLSQQGGPMTVDEVAEFRRHAHSGAAIQLRKWEDNFGKTHHQTIPDFAFFRPLLERVLIPD